MPCAYVLRSKKTGKQYVGSSHSNSAAKRVAEHNAGKSRWTKAGMPWILVHEEYFESYTEARKRENFLKSGQGRKQIKESLGGVAEPGCPPEADPPLAERRSKDAVRLCFAK